VRLPWIAIVLLAGCAAEPFERPPLPVLDNPNPAVMRANFAHSLADKFTSDDTIVIDAPFHKMTILGVLEVDRNTGKFELVGLNPMGVELFHLSGDGGGTKIQSALPPLMEQKEVLFSIGQDIRRMYFDLLPAESAVVDLHSTFVHFSEKMPEGTMVHEMGDEPTVLLEKRLQGCFGAIWRVRYYQYAAKDGGLYPRGIVMDNAQYHYRIIVKNRDWQSN